jgi:uncharacterized protein involved in response to NO
LLFGYVPAIIAGFLMTAVPNWTGRMPVVGWPLAGLVALWLVGRLLVAFGAGLPPLLLAGASMAFLAVLIAVMGREIVAGRNLRNLKVLVAVGMLLLAQGVFHVEAATTGTVVHGDRLAIAAILMLILIIAGRIVPSFTGNWLRRARPGIEPVPMNRFDLASMGVAGLALALWVALPAIPGLGLPVGIVLVAAGLFQVVRQARWRPLHTGAEPLVAVLHVAFLFVPLGFLTAGAGLVHDLADLSKASIHLWTIGAIGLMTLAVMTRATRGHTGHDLTAPPATVAIYAGVVIAALCRAAAALFPAAMLFLLPIAGIAWVSAMLGFCAVYGPMLISRRAG